MKPIPPEIKILYDAVLVEKGVPLPVHFHYRKWLRYCLNFVLPKLIVSNSDRTIYV